MSTRHTPLTVQAIAERINAHLKRFEADPEINQTHIPSKTKRFWNAGAWSSGRWIHVRYISYQGNSTLTREEGLMYMRALDAGRLSKHFEILREAP